MSQQAQSIDARGKHRILAELKRLEQETRFAEVSFYFRLASIPFLWDVLLGGGCSCLQ